MKKILLTLFAWILWFWCFCSADYWISFPWRWTVNFNSDNNNRYDFSGGVCFNTASNSAWTFVNWDFYDSNWTLLYSHDDLSSLNIRFICFSNDWYVQSLYNNTTIYTYSYENWVLFWDLWTSWWWSCPECPEINTWEILSWYILESEIDTNYCVWNWLCPNECWSWTDFSWDLVFSNLYINSILHPWKSNIFVEIPDYITWDYSTDTWSFNLYVWSWYDVDYINSIIDINSYRPDSKDFTDIFVWGLTLITPYIVICLFFFLVWKLLRRIFK